MEKILIVEDSASFARKLKDILTERLGVSCQIAGSMADARQMIIHDPEGFFVSITDLNLPDSFKGEVVDMLNSNNIPAIIITGAFEEETRDTILKKRVLDYIIKKDERTFSAIETIVKRLIRNRSVRILVVDDSRSARYVIRNLLEVQKFNVIEAENSTRALEQLDREPGIKMVITDYQMPVMDGFELITRIREKYDDKQLAIIGISSLSSESVSARFLKTGANDFIVKPFIIEEFYSRINQNIELLDYIQELKDISVRDYLTGAYSRRYLFEKGEELYKSGLSSDVPPVISSIRIDKFPEINKQISHKGGDQLIVSVAKEVLNNFVDGYFVARFSGIEFLVLGQGKDQAAEAEKLEKFVSDIAGKSFTIDGKNLQLTVSAAQLSQPQKNLDQAIAKIGALLLKARETGNTCITDIKQSE